MIEIILADCLDFDASRKTQLANEKITIIKSPPFNETLFRGRTARGHVIFIENFLEDGFQKVTSERNEVC